MGKPRVTWLLTVNNNEKTLEQTLESIAGQAYASQSVYAWDLGSTDRSTTILKRWVGRELPGRIVGTARMDRGRALAMLAAQAQTELIARIDPGTSAEPDRLTRQVEYLMDHRKVGVLGSQMQQAGTRAASTSYPTRDAELRWALRFTNPVSQPTVLLRRSAVLEAGNYREARGGPEDYDLWVRMAVIVRFATIDMPLTRYVSEQSAAPNTKRQAAQRFYHTRDALIDRLLPGTDPTAGRRLLNLVRDTEDLHVTADDILRFRHAAMLAAKACRYAPNFYTNTALFKQQMDNLKTRRLKGQPLVRPVWPLLKRASKLINKPASSNNNAAA